MPDPLERLSLALQRYRVLDPADRPVLARPYRPGDIGGDGSWHVELPFERRVYRLVRGTDHLLLAVRFVGLELRTGPPPVLVRRGREPGHVVVDLGPQHVLEQAFFETAGPDVKASPSQSAPPPGSDALAHPVRTSLAESSRLVFSVTTQEIPYTVDGLLDALTRLPLSVAPHANGAVLRRSVLGAVDALGLRRELLPVGRPSRARDLRRLSAMRRDAVLTRDAELVTASSRVGRMVRAAAVVNARFGPQSALAAVVDPESLGVAIGQPHVDLGSVLLRPLAPPPEPRPLTATETAIELPWRLQVSPGSGAGFHHAVAPVTHDGRTELWHTRLGTRHTQPDEQHTNAPFVDESDPSARSIRAVWARDYDVPGQAFGLGPAAFPGDDFGNTAAQRPFRASLTPRDRMMLVHQTSNHHGPMVGHTPHPAAVDTMLLTALGGWLGCQANLEPGTGVSLLEWLHRATMGRDHYVKVVYAGILAPFGHRAALVKVTERQIRTSPTTGRPYAPLTQRLYVVVREPERRFRQTGKPRLDNGMPFTWVRILTASTPALAKPTPIAGPGNGQVFVPHIATSDAAGAAGEQPFHFKVLACDRDNHLVEFEGPMVFIERSRLQDAGKEAVVDKANDRSPAYPLLGQQVAFAAPGDADDTSFATTSMTFDAVLESSAGDNFVVPTLRVAQAPVPALTTFTGQTDAVRLSFPDAFLDHGPSGPGNSGEVFLQLAEADGGPAASPVTMGFATQSQRSGGFVAPSVDIRGLARRVGPVGGDLAALASNPAGFDVGSMFNLDAAKLFGVVSLSDLLPSIDGVLPKFVTQSLDTVAGFLSVVTQVRALTTSVGGQLSGAAGDVSAQLTTIGTRATEVVTALEKLVKGDPAVPDLGAAVADLGAAASAVRAVLTRPAVRAVVPRPQLDALDALLRQVADTAADAATLVSAITAYAKGLQLPERVSGRLEWTTPLETWAPLGGTPVFDPLGDRLLRLVCLVTAPVTGSGDPEATVSCALPPFVITLLGDAKFIAIRVAVMELSMTVGRKPDVNVELDPDDGIEFLGPLAFVEALKDIIPFDGFSDPPYLDVEPSGLRAGFDLAIPDLGVGVFALTNIHLGAELVVPFIGESLEFRFFFATREDPFRLSVALFAGGGFFAITLSPKGVRTIEAAFEFGACVAMSFVVASGEISVMAGIYFRLDLEGSTQRVQLTGYFRARGEVDVLGLISACIELYLELSYIDEGGKSKAIGKASISVEVSVCFLSFSVTVSCEKKLAGSQGDPTFVDTMSPYTDWRGRQLQPWPTYCSAFAPEPI